MAKAIDVDVTINEAFFRQLGNSAEVEAILDAIADATVVEAKASAPVDTGAYRDSIHKTTVQAKNRKIKRVIADDWKSALLEVKTGNLSKALGRAKRL